MTVREAGPYGVRVGERMASGHPYGARNRSDRFPANWVSTRFPHPALRATMSVCGALWSPCR